jgi:hypothetical protein
LYQNRHLMSQNARNVDYFVHFMHHFMCNSA